MPLESPKNKDESEDFVSFSEFLQVTPPNQLKEVRSVIGTVLEKDYKLATPEIQLHCDNEKCKGVRTYRCLNDGVRINASENLIFLHYVCANCASSIKVFSLGLYKVRKPGLFYLCDVLKLGELPPFGPPVPSRLITLIGPDREAFLSGRRCENQGLGIGAFVYYRRVVENQKNRILEEIIRVASKVGAKEEYLQLLRDAVQEIQFSKAMDMAKPAIPESLLINGHNPIALLHSALSEGVHKLSDDECLEIASSIRVVLVELSERLSNALKDEEELNNAVHKLMNLKKKS